MDNFNLINAFLFAMYWLLELLKAVGWVILIPLYILFAPLAVGTNDFFPYCSVIIHSRINRLKTFGLTFKLTIDKRSPHISVRSYDEEAKEASERINEKKHTTIRTCVTHGLNGASRYMYVIFQKNDTGITFIQLRTDTGVYLLDFPLTKLTLNRDYAVEVIKLLRAKGYVKKSMYQRNSYIIDSEGEDMTTIQANLGKDKAQVIDMCMAIYTKVFKTKTVPQVIFG